MATKDAIAQNIMAHDALYKRAILLDQFKEGLKKIGIFSLIAMFPEEMSGLFIYQGVLTSKDVCGALYIEDEDGMTLIRTMRMYSTFYYAMSIPSLKKVLY